MTEVAPKKENKREMSIDVNQAIFLLTLKFSLMLIRIDLQSHHKRNINVYSLNRRLSREWDSALLEKGVVAWL